MRWILILNHFSSLEDNKESRHPLQMGEAGMEDKESPTNSSNSPNVASVTRQVTSIESTQTQRNTTILRNYSHPSLEERIAEPILYNDKPIDPENPQVASISQSPALETGRIKTLAQRIQTAGPVAYHGLSNPATVLLTNTYDEWSNFCVALGSDGNIDILDSRLHDSAKGKARVSRNEYTTSFAINGEWIGPGELALVHKSPRANREVNHISLIKYMDTQFRMNPQITPLRQSPHSKSAKIMAIAPLWRQRGGKIIRNWRYFIPRF